MIISIIFNKKFMISIFIYFSIAISFIPNQNSIFNSKTHLVFDKLIVEQTSGKRGAISEYHLISKERSYYITRDVIFYTDFKLLESTVKNRLTLEVVYFRRFFGIFGHRIILDLKLNNKSIVNVNEYQNDFSFVFYLTMVATFYLIVGALFHLAKLIYKQKIRSNVLFL